jgi:hypothetical protein
MESTVAGKIIPTLLATLICILPAAALAFFSLKSIGSGNRAVHEREAERAQFIWSKRELWGEEACAWIEKRQVEPGMTEEMVLLSWGKPNYVDQDKKTKSYFQERWVYG